MEWGLPFSSLGGGTLVAIFDTSILMSQQETLVPLLWRTYQIHRQKDRWDDISVSRNNHRRSALERNVVGTEKSEKFYAGEDVAISRTQPVFSEQTIIIALQCLKSRHSMIFCGTAVYGNMGNFLHIMGL